VAHADRVLFAAARRKHRLTDAVRENFAQGKIGRIMRERLC